MEILSPNFIRLWQSSLALPGWLAPEGIRTRIRRLLSTYVGTYTHVSAGTLVLVHLHDNPASATSILRSVPPPPLLSSLPLSIHTLQNKHERQQEDSSRRRRDKTGWLTKFRPGCPAYPRYLPTYPVSCSPDRSFLHQSYRYPSRPDLPPRATLFVLSHLLVPRGDISLPISSCSCRTVTPHLIASPPHLRPPHHPPLTTATRHLPG